MEGKWYTLVKQDENQPVMRLSLDLNPVFHRITQIFADQFSLVALYYIWYHDFGLGCSSSMAAT